MPLRFSPHAPSDAHERIREYISRDADVPTTRGMKALREYHSLGTSDGIETWILDLDDIEAGALDRAERSAWRYLVFEDDRVLCEVHLDAESGASRIAAMSEGPTTAGLLGAFSVAEALDATQAHDLEPRLLLAPSVTFVALWLHATESGVDDVFIPIPPSQPPLAHGTPVSEAQLVSALQVAARDLRATMDAAPGPSGGSGGDAAKWPSEARPKSLRVWSLSLDAAPKARTREVAMRAPQAAPPAEERARQLPRFMQHQEQSNWCWAAVATSVGILLKTGHWTQCDTASRCLSLHVCCSDPTTCNKYGYLDKALEQTKSLDFYDEVPATKTRIQRHIGEGRPIGTRIAWRAGGSHFMAITGFSLDDNDEMTITIQDPQYGRSTMRLADYPAKYPAGSGRWTHTYYCKS